MPETTAQSRPKILYRGITLPADAIGEEIFTADLQPGGEALIDEQGQKTVEDGNEYGVYMSDNAHMSEFAYATPRRGDAAPDSPKFNWEGSSQSTITTPRIGVLYEVSTQGINIRKPNIASHLQGHYNNGFEGEEWIADRVPAQNHTVTKLTLGPDTLHDAQEFTLDDGHQTALEALRDEIAFRSGRLATASELIDEMPGKHRHFPGMPERALAELKAPRRNNSSR